MLLSRGQERGGQARTQMRGDGGQRYASGEEVLKILDEDMNGLYQLSFLLAGDGQKGERVFGGGIEDCVKENRVFREWARAWAKRVIVEKAIRELHPRWSHSKSFVVLPIVFSRNQQSGGPIGHFDADAVLGLADFERFVFVLCVLERYREHECALLLGCSASEVRDARTRAIEELASSAEVASSRYEDRKLGQLAAARMS